MSAKRSIKEEFTVEANDKVVSIVAKESGFHGIQSTALESFTHLLGSYMEKMFKSAHTYAELGNRCKPNIHDITRSLENAGVEIESFQQYLSTKVNDIDAMQKTNKYFKTSTSSATTLEQTPEFLPSDHEESSDDDEYYVPRHLPHFPSKHSFKKTPIYIDRPDDPQKVRELNSEQSRTVEENLKKLMSAENQLLRQANVESALLLTPTEDNMMPIVNYEGFIQRRKRSKNSGTTLNVEGSDEPNKKKKKSNNNDGEEDIEEEIEYEEEEEEEANAENAATSEN